MTDSEGGRHASTAHTAVEPDDSEPCDNEPDPRPSPRERRARPGVNLALR